MEKHRLVSFPFPNPKNNLSDSKIIPLHHPKVTDSLPKETQIPTKLCLSLLEGHVIIPIQDIVRLESSSNYTLIFTSDNRRYVISKTLKMIQALLPSEQFVRCHNSHLVNKFEISSFKKESLTLGLDTEIPIARQKFKAVMQAITSHCITV